MNLHFRDGGQKLLPTSLTHTFLHIDVQMHLQVLANQTGQVNKDELN
jgi:hypothetical protein